jgi:nitrous oxide reductase accessory protein NosL
MAEKWSLCTSIYVPDMKKGSKNERDSDNWVCSSKAFLVVASNDLHF